MIKPQFEAEKKFVNKGGVITDPHIHKEVIDQIVKSAKEQGWSLLGVVPSPIEGTAGNREFLALFKMP